MTYQYWPNCCVLSSNEIQIEIINPLAESSQGYPDKFTSVFNLQHPPKLNVYLLYTFYNPHIPMAIITADVFYIPGRPDRHQV